MGTYHFDSRNTSAEKTKKESLSPYIHTSTSTQEQLEKIEVISTKEKRKRGGK